MNAPLAASPTVAAAAAAVVAARDEIAVRHAAGENPLATGRLAAERFDRIVLDVWEAMLDGLPAATAAAVRADVVLVALGGYGRRDMVPFSDIDLMLLHGTPRTPLGRGPAVIPPGRRRDHVAAAAKRLLQDLFDAGLEVGQSVRTPAEACRLALGDAVILASLLDARRLTGLPEAWDAFQGRLTAAIARRSRTLAGMLVDARREEAEKYGRTAALLEPNVKRSPGGLRDIQFVTWLDRVVNGTTPRDDEVGYPRGAWDGAVAAGDLTRRDADALAAATEFLTWVRTDLHLATRKAADDLTRDQQVRIAKVRGCADHDGLLGVERFMREYFGHTRRVAQIAEAFTFGLREPGLVDRAAAAVLGHRSDGLFRIGPREIAILPGRTATVTGSLAMMVRLVELAMFYDLPIEPASWQAVRDAAPLLPRDPDEAGREAFLRLFDCSAGVPAGLADALRRLHEAGLLEIFIPAFAHARDLLQFNNYHKYTVDEHSLRAVGEVVASARGDGWLAEAWRRLDRRRPLLLAALLHDLGKGRDGDHSEVGAEIARVVSGRLQLPADEAEIVEFLVLRHLAMGHLAFRRNTGDESLVLNFAREVGSPEVLRMLAILTVADMTAVGPGTWTRWKADVLGELFFRTLGHLDGESPSYAAEETQRQLERLLEARGPEDPVVQLARGLPVSYLRDTPAARIVEELGRLARLSADGVFTSARWQPETATVAVTVGTHEGVVSGIFHRITGALSVQRLEILAADIHTLAGGLVLDHFVVLDHDFAGPPPPDRLADIAAALRLALRADAPPDFRTRWNPFAPRLRPAAEHPVRVRFDNASSREATILEVFAHDSVGLLFRIASVLHEGGVSVHSAKIGTYLDQVVDAFHVTDRGGGKLLDPERLAALGRALEAAARLSDGGLARSPVDR